jgi:hypothetical protein
MSHPVGSLWYTHVCLLASSAVLIKCRSVESFAGLLRLSLSDPILHSPICPDGMQREIVPLPYGVII